MYMKTCTQMDKCNKINWFLTIKNICCIKAEVLYRLLENLKSKEKLKSRLQIRKLSPEMGNQNVPELIDLHICPLIKSVSTLSFLQEAPAPRPQVPIISWQNYGIPQLCDHFQKLPKSYCLGRGLHWACSCLWRHPALTLLKSYNRFPRQPLSHFSEGSDRSSFTFNNCLLPDSFAGPGPCCMTSVFTANSPVFSFPRISDVLSELYPQLSAWRIWE